MRLILILLYLLISSFLVSQSVNEDSLIQITQDVSSEKTDVIQAHNNLARYYLRNDTAKAAFHLSRLEEIVRADRDTSGIILALDLRLRQAASKSNYDDAERIAREQLRLSKAINKVENYNKVYNALGVIKNLKYEFDSALYYLDTSYRLKLELSDGPNIGVLKSINNLAATAMQTDQYKLALEYYLEGLKMARKLGDDENLAMIHSGMGNVYGKLQDVKNARLYFSRAYDYAFSVANHMTMGDALQNIGSSYKEELPDTAIYYLKRALESYEKIGNQERIGLSAIALGDALNNKGSHQQALSQIERAHEIYVTTRNQKRRIDAESRLAKTNYELGRYAIARTYMDEVIGYYDSQQDLKSRYQAYSLLSKISEQQGNLTEALEAQRTYQLLKDSLDQKVYDRELVEVKVELETEIKEAEIERQKIVIEQQEAQQKSFIIITLLGGILLVFTLWGVYQRSKKNIRIANQNVLIQEQKIEQLEKEKKILSMNAMIEGQEAERTRIAKDLHDGLGGLLSTVKAHFSNIQREIKQLEGLKVYDRAQDMMDEACDEVRRISHNLMPGALRLEGLKSAVEQLGQEMSDAHPFAVKVETVHFETRMEESKEVFVYRIIQESLNNIVKHAAAKEVLIQMSETTDEYHYIIEDDGKGFDPLQIQSGLGLKSIQSRVDFLGGNLDIDTREGVGTTLSFSVPKASKAQESSSI